MNYEVLNNLVVEMTRLSIEMKNHRMRVESIAGRLDFDERRARALEGVVQYREGGGATGKPSVEAATAEEVPGGPSRRRRRRRGRRRSSSAVQVAESGETAPSESPAVSTGPEPDREMAPPSGETTEPTGETRSPAREAAESPGETSGSSGEVPDPAGEEGSPPDVSSSAGETTEPPSGETGTPKP